MPLSENLYLKGSHIFTSNMQHEQQNVRKAMTNVDSILKSRDKNEYSLYHLSLKE